MDYYINTLVQHSITELILRNSRTSAYTLIEFLGSHQQQTRILLMYLLSLYTATEFSVYTISTLQELARASPQFSLPLPQNSIYRHTHCITHLRALKLNSYTVWHTAHYHPSLSLSSRPSNGAVLAYKKHPIKPMSAATKKKKKRARYRKKKSTK